MLTLRLAERLEPFRQGWRDQLDVRRHGHFQRTTALGADQESGRVHLAAWCQGGRAYVRIGNAA